MQEISLKQMSLMPFPLILMDKNLIIHKTNLALNMLLKLNDDDLVDQNLLDVITPNTPYKPTSMLQAKKRSSLIYATLKKNNKPDEIFLFEIHFDISTETAWVLVSQDKSCPLEYRDVSQRLYRITKAMESTSLGLWEYNLLTKNVYFSLKFRELIGVDAEQSFSWQQCLDAVYEEDQAIFTSFFNNHIKSHIPLDFEFRMIIKGKINWFTLRGETFFENDQAITIMGTLADCSQNKQILNALNNAIESKNIAMDVGKIGTWKAALNEHNHWAWSWDDLANDIYGMLAVDQGNFDKWSESIHPKDKMRVINALEKSLDSGKIFDQSFRFITMKGEVRCIVAKGRVGKDSRGKYYRIDGICVDETSAQQNQLELKKTNLDLEKRVSIRTEELIKSKERAEKASQIKTDFLSMMSHELRTPMNAIIGSLDLLQSSHQDMESKELTDIAKSSAENLVFILNDILDINKIEAGKLDIEDLTFSVAEIVDNVINVYIPVARKKQITIEVLEDPRVPIYVKGDAIRVRQILFNLVGNALKFTSSTNDKKGKVIIKIEEIEKNHYVSNISFKIIDNGIGIAKDTQELLFKPFIQAELSTTRKYGGTGLGLAICGNLTQMMGGRITLTSDLGQGATFDVDIPFWKSQETRAMDIIELAGISVTVLTLHSQLTTKIAFILEHLENAGADVNFIPDSEVESLAQPFDILLLMVDDFAQDEEALSHLIKQVDNDKKVIIATEYKDLDQVKNSYVKIKTIDVNSLTHIKLIDTIQKVKQHSLEFDFEDLDKLNLDFNDAENENLDELSFDLDLDALENPGGTTSKNSGLKSGILLIEDNTLNQKIIVKQLKNIGYSCDVANDGVEGKDKWFAGDYHLILTDCHMPNLDGYEMTKLIRSLEQENKRDKIPIIAVTGAAMSGDAKQCYDAGMDDFVSKPIQQKDLKKVLDKWYSNE